jgi:hypothetical protein
MNPEPTSFIETLARSIAHILDECRVPSEQRTAESVAQLGAALIETAPPVDGEISSVAQTIAQNVNYILDTAGVPREQRTSQGVARLGDILSPLSVLQSPELL